MHYVVFFVLGSNIFSYEKKKLLGENSLNA